MKFLFILLVLLNISNLAKASIEESIIKKIQNTNNISFNFIQKNFRKNEKGQCTILYPKKIYCKYFDKKNKILVSNGKSLVIKTKSTGGYYIYPLKKTPLNLILDKNFLINKIKNSKIKNINQNIAALVIEDNDLTINVFFNQNNFNLIGWDIIDIYNNKNSIELFKIVLNKEINKDMFELPKLDN